jgi:hypothetical protein
LTILIVPTAFDNQQREKYGTLLTPSDDDKHVRHHSGKRHWRLL